jgi:iron complex transport system permease protein
MVGISLSLSGLLMQRLIRNPLADPSLLGVNAGAGFFILLGNIVFEVKSELLSSALAFLGALLVSIMVILVGRFSASSRFSSVRLIISGIAFSSLFEGCTSYLVLLHPDSYDYLRFWHSGSLDIRDVSIIGITLPIILIGILVSFPLARTLGNFSMGHSLAIALGTRIKLTLVLSLLVISLLSSAATTISGPIAFLGILSPHLSGWLLGNDTRLILPCTMLVGPSFLLAADIIGRIVSPAEIHVATICAILASPVLLVIARSHYSISRSSI